MAAIDVIDLVIGVLIFITIFYLLVRKEGRRVPLSTLNGKEYALQALAARRDHRPEQIDNARLYAGSPMYYYCVSCGHLADTKPGNWFLTRPKRLCEECQALKDLGWLE